jgi:hypothetical protein
VLKERKEGRKRKVSFFGLPHGPRPGARCPWGWHVTSCSWRSEGQGKRRGSLSWSCSWPSTVTNLYQMSKMCGAWWLGKGVVTEPQTHTWTTYEPSLQCSCGFWIWTSQIGRGGGYDLSFRFLGLTSYVPNLTSNLRTHVVKSTSLGWWKVKFNSDCEECQLFFRSLLLLSLIKLDDLD